MPGSFDESGIAEGGLASGLSITFDTWNNESSEETFGGETTFGRAELKLNGEVIAVSPVQVFRNEQDAQSGTDSYVDVVVEHTDAGLYASYGGTALFNGIDLGSAYAPASSSTPYQYVLAAREVSNGDEKHRVDDLKITVPGSNTRVIDMEGEREFSDNFTSKGADQLVMEFNGSTNYISLGTPSKLNFSANSVTVEAWIKTSATTSGSIMTKTQDGAWAAGGKQFTILGDGKLMFNEFGATPIVATTAVNDGNWHHVAYVLTENGGSDQLRFYVDGSLETISSGAGAGGTVATFGRVDDTAGHEVFIGTSASTSQFFNGQMAEVRVWNTARTAGEISDAMTQDIGGASSQTGLVGYYNFENIQGQTVLDGAANPSVAHLGQYNTAKGAGDPTLVAAAIDGPDASKWVVVDGGHLQGGINTADDSARVVNGDLVLENRELLRTKDEFDPSATDPIHLTGRFTLNHDDDFFSIWTRANPVPDTTTDAYGYPTSGILLQANPGSSTESIGIAVKTGAGAVGTHTNLALTGQSLIEFEIGRVYEFEVFDDGTNLRFSVTDVDNPTTSASVTATSTFNPATNFVVLHNREEIGSTDYILNLHEISIDQGLVTDQEDDRAMGLDVLHRARCRAMCAGIGEQVDHLSLLRRRPALPGGIGAQVVVEAIHRGASGTGSRVGPASWLRQGSDPASRGRLFTLIRFLRGGKEH